MRNEERITYFAETDARNRRVAFGIKAKDRLKHVYVIGKTGMGKSTLLENMAVQDIQNGEGMAFLDPHGKSADLLLEYVPPERIKDVIYFAPFDTEYPISFNVLEDVDPEKRHLVVSGLMSAFKKIWKDAWSARMEYILTNCLLALLEYPDATIMGVNKMLSDKDYRKKIVDNVTDPTVRTFWVDEFAKYGQNYMQEAGAAIQNKIGQFTTNPVIRNVIGQPKSSFDIRKAMDSKKIFIINLSKGRIGEVNANLLGSMLITKMYLGAMSRADMSEAELSKAPNFYLYVDEFQSFANDSFKDILSEARKYKLNLTIAHQYIEQMEEEIRAAVIGNVGTMITFRVGAFDAQVLEKEFAPTFMAQDLVNLGFTQVYLKLMINGVSSAPFSATSLPPIKKPAVMHVPAIIENSRRIYAQPRAIVEEQIRLFSSGGIHSGQLQEGAKPAAAGAGQAPSAPLRAPEPKKYEEPARPRNDPERFEADRRDRGPRDRDPEPERPRPRPQEPKKNPFAGIKLPNAAEAPEPEEDDESDVLSLSALKPAAKKPVANTGNQKIASAENMKTLRDALAGVLKKDGGQGNKTQEAREEKKAEERKAEERKAPEPKAQKPESDPGRSRDHRHEPRREPENQRSSDAENRRAAKEVPEEVLRKVLSMEEKA